jgi:hypothetical protein
MLCITFMTAQKTLTDAVAVGEVVSGNGRQKDEEI